MPRKKATTDALTAQFEIDFLKSHADKILQINQQLDIGIYPKLGVATLVFILSLYNILNTNQNGVVGFIVIAVGSVMASLFTVYSFKQSANGHGYENIVLNGLLSHSSEKFQSNLEELLGDKNNLVEFYKRQIVSLVKMAQKKRRLQEISLYILTMSYLVGIILIILLP